ncbi:MAG: class I SAM-dependent methyltransferase [Calditrichota bacterium]
MEYDPIKFRLARLIGGRLVLRRMFHLTLDLLFLRAWFIRRELKRLKNRLPERDLCILDAGMGFGQFSDRMLRLFPQAWLIGLEVDRSYFYGGERYFQILHPRARLILGDVQNLPLPANCVDLITCVDVMEHIPDDRAAFTEYARILRPGGYFLMHTPRVQDDQEMIEGGTFDPDSCQVGEHVRNGYRDQEARERLETAGLVIDQIIHGYGAPGRLAWRLLQGVPMALLSRGRGGVPLAALWLIPALPWAIILMGLDVATSSHKRGGSLLITARKPFPGEL